MCKPIFIPTELLIFMGWSYMVENVYICEGFKHPSCLTQLLISTRVCRLQLKKYRSNNYCIEINNI